MGWSSPQQRGRSLPGRRAVHRPLGPLPDEVIGSVGTCLCGRTSPHRPPPRLWDQESPVVGPHG